MDPVTLRSRALDLLAGMVGLAVCASALLLQNLSSRLMEYALIVLPIVIFPAVTWLRVRAGSRWIAFFCVNIWLVVAEFALARLALASVTALLVPLAIGLVAGAIVATSPTSVRAATLVIAAAAGMLIAPGVWNGLLSSSISMRAPGLVLTLLDGRNVRLADLRGRVVVLNFWGVWCGPCVREMPELASFAHKRAAVVIAVDSGIGRETPADISRFVRAHNLDLTVAFDPDRTAYKAFGVRALPTTIVIDPQGIARIRRVGFASTANYGAWLANVTHRFAS